MKLIEFTEKGMTHIFLFGDVGTKRLVFPDKQIYINPDLVDAVIPSKCGGCSIKMSGKYTSLVESAEEVMKTLEMTDAHGKHGKHGKGDRPKKEVKKPKKIKPGKKK